MKGQVEGKVSGREREDVLERGRSWGRAVRINEVLRRKRKLREREVGGRGKFARGRSGQEEGRITMDCCSCSIIIRYTISFTSCFGSSLENSESL